MKVKILTLLAALFLVCNISSAQGVGTFKAKKKTAVVKKNIAPQRQGTFIMPKVGVGLNFTGYYHEMFFNLQAVLGHEFNNHFALGIGAGLNNCITVDDTYGNIVYDRMLIICIPLYVNIHGDFSKHKTTAYYSLDLGVQMPIRKAIGLEYYFHYYCDDGDYVLCDNNKFIIERFFGGFFISPEIGIRFNSCYLGANFNYASVHKRHHSENQNHDHLNFEGLNGDYHSCILSLKFGYKIPLNLKR